MAKRRMDVSLPEGVESLVPDSEQQGSEAFANQRKQRKGHDDNALAETICSLAPVPVKVSGPRLNANRLKTSLTVQQALTKAKVCYRIHRKLYVHQSRPRRAHDIL